MTMPSVLLALALAVPAAAAEAPAIDWQHGPVQANLEDIAEITVPEGYLYTGKKGCQEIMKMTGNLVSNQETGFLAPAGILENTPGQQWFVVFEFSPIGYVKDEEKDKLDKDALLKQLQEGNVRGNKEREKRGIPTLDLVGWAVEPHYNPETNNLEWALELKSEKGTTINYEVRLLGRKGVMSCTLVLSPAELNDTLPSFRSMLGGYAYKSGQKYAEYKPGDALAKVGLAALIGGGAAALAYKTGLLQKFWKFLVLVLVAVAGFFKKIWNRLFGKPDSAD